jgi:hypothetical protein
MAEFINIIRRNSKKLTAGYTPQSDTSSTSSPHFPVISKKQETEPLRMTLGDTTLLYTDNEWTRGFFLFNFKVSLSHF